MAKTQKLLQRSMKEWVVTRLVRTEEIIGVSARSEEEAREKIRETGGYLVKEEFHSVDDSEHEDGIKSITQVGDVK